MSRAGQALEAAGSDKCRTAQLDRGCSSGDDKVDEASGPGSEQRYSPATRRDRRKDAGHGPRPGRFRGSQAEAQAPAPDQGEGAAPGGEDEGYSTFRPSPVGEPSSRNPKRAGAYVTKSGRDRPYESYGGGFEVPASGPTLWERILFGRVSTGQLAQFCRQFAAYLNAGVDINRSLSSLNKQFSRYGAGADPGPGAAFDSTRVDA